MSQDPETDASRSAARGRKHEKHLSTFEGILLLTRWLQLPLLIGLVVALVILEIKFIEHLINTVFAVGALTHSRVLLVILDLIDMVLIANLVVVIVISGYETFISRLQMMNQPGVPDWMRRSTAGQLKLRVATTILLISTIHLLHVYLDPADVDEVEATYMMIAQVIFIVTAAAFVIFNWLEHGPRTRRGE